MILVLFAIREEAGDFVDWLGRQNAGRREKIRVAYVGIGAEAVRKKLPAILQDQRPDLLICAGFAGALTEELKLGEVFLASNRTTLQQSFSHLKVARIYSAATVLESPSEREECARQESAQAVDMESEAVFEIATKVSIPLLMIRSITDTADAPIPIPFGVSYDLERQRVKKWAVLFWLLSNPIFALDFFQFLIRLKTARLHLAVGLAKALDQLLAEKPSASLK